jgi:hypothetical protein
VESRNIGSGWNFATVISGGGRLMLALKPDGHMLAYQRNGYVDGKPLWASQPVPAGNTWQGFKSIFSGGENVVYGIRQNGDLMWSVYQGGQWAPQRQVDNGWGHFKKVCGAGYGLIYALQEDGVLLRYNHIGYLTGDATWQSFRKRGIGPIAPETHYESLGSGWGQYRDVLPGADGVVYGIANDGRIYWYRFGTRPAAGALRKVLLPGDHLEGPVEVGQGRATYLLAFPLTPGVVPAIH